MLVAPALMAEWLGLSTVVDATWTLQMLGAALLGLSGQMWLVRRAPDHPVLGAAVVMIISGGLMTVRWAYLGVGAAFCLAYILLILVSRRRP